MTTAQVSPAKRRANRRLALVLFVVVAAVFCLFVALTLLR